MDPQHFDAFVKTLSRSVARRSMLLSFMTGAVVSLVTPPGAAARRNAQGDDGASADRRKKKKRKKCKKCGPCATCKKGKAKCKRKPDGIPCAGGRCRGGVCRQVDEAPPCTEQSCPLPPGCNQHTLEQCSTPHLQAMLDAAEACQAACEGGDDPACRDCLTPIISEHLPAIEACTATSCGRPVEGANVAALPGATRGTARAWWPRSCESSTCCYISKRDCETDATEALFECFGVALVGFIASGGLGGPAILGGMFFCIAKLVYEMEKCQARYGCPDHKICREGDICCDPAFCPASRIHCPIPGEPVNCTPRCCPENTKVCCNGTCCSSENAKCCGTKSVCYGKEVDCSTV